MDGKTEFFDCCGVIRDQYIRAIRQATEQHKARAREIEKGYKGTLARTENEKNKARLTEATAAAKDKARAAIEDSFVKAEARERAKVGSIMIGQDYLKALDGLKNCPVSAEEFDLICVSCSGKGYWVEQRLRALAEENGIMKTPLLDATYSEKMTALNTAKERMLSFIENGDTEALNPEITDKALRLLESNFSNGFKNYSMSAEKKAAVLLDQVKNMSDVYAAANKVKNLLETSPDDVKRELLRSVSADNSYWGNIREIGGLQKVLDNIRKEEEKERKISEKQALKMVSDARLAPAVAKLSESEREAALYGSSIAPVMMGEERKIDQKGLDYISTEEGAAKVKEFEKIKAKVAAYAADQAEEARERARIEGE